MNWEQAFFITATLEMWGSIIVILILCGEIIRLVRQVKKGAKQVSRLGWWFKYGILKRLLSMMGGDENG